MANKVGYVTASVGLLTDVDTVQRNTLGAKVFDDAGGEYIYLPGVAALVAGDFVFFNISTYVPVRLVTAITAGAVAVAMGATLAANWGWFQILGIVTSANIATDGAANGKPLYASASAGRATTTAAAGTAIFGAAAQGASASNVGNAYFAAHPFTMANATL